ncbi:MAG TPA: hypothetical protein VLF14_00005, partial [Candidatus Binatia bacterium]|nr:hypothetical protein [Candidatus Binatia bacterium]
QMGLIGPREVANIEQGKQQNYLAHGSIEDERKKRHLKNYHLIFRILPITPAPVIDFILEHRLHRWFRYLPQTPIIILVDLVVSVLKRDYYAMWAIRTYGFELKRRFTERFFGARMPAYKSAPAEVGSASNGLGRTQLLPLVEDEPFTVGEDKLASSSL